MEKHKKTLSLVLVLCFALVAIFSGCTGTVDETPSDSSSNPASEVTSEATEEPLEEVTLSWYFPAFGGAQANEQAVYDEINKLVKEKINAEISFYPVDPGSYETKINTMLAASEEFDICFTASWFNNYWQNVSKGAFVALDDLVEDYAPNIKADIPSKYFDAVRVDGKFYGLVNYQIIPVTQGFWINTDILDTANIDVETLKKNWSIEDLKLLTPVFKAWKEEYPNTFPFHVGADGGFGVLANVFNMSIVQSPAAVKIDDETLTAYNIYKSDEYKEFISITRDWYLNDYIPKNVITGEGISDFFKGEAAVYFDGNVKPLDKLPEFEFNYERVAISDPIISTGAVASTLNAISITSKNPERAMMFLDIVNSDKQVYNTLNFGIEGVNYNKVDENTIEKIADSGYDPNIAWVFGNQFNSYIQKGGNPNVWEDTKAVNDSGIPTTTLGFVFNPESVSNEITAVNSVINEYANIIQTGSVDTESNYDEFIKKLDASGAQAIVDEVQKQLDAWKASK